MVDSATVRSRPERRGRRPRPRAPLTSAVMAGVLACGHGIVAAAADPIDLSETPLFVGNPVNPNVFMQLDDSGSMGSESISRDPAFDLNDYQGTDQEDYDYDPTTPSNCNTFPGFGTFCSDSRDWREDFRSPTSNALAFVHDPAERQYDPWWDTDYGDSTFSNARDWPTESSTEDLTGSTFYEWIDDAGSDNCPPTGPGDFNTGNVNNCGNDVADAWDSFRVFTINAGSIDVETYSFSPDGSGANSSSTSTTLTGGPHPELHGQTVAEVQQRYANYHTYFRTRRHVLTAAVGETLRSFPNFRFGVDTIHERFFVEMPDASENAPYTSHNKDLFDEVKDELIASGGTPLRDAVDKAGEYYADDLGADSPINHECQQNFTLAITDGFWNRGHGGTGDVDGDGNSNLLADIGRHYYETDLDASLPDAVQSTVEDPATGTTQDQQHMVSYGVAFGVTGNLEDTDADGQPDNDTTGTLSPPFDVGSEWTDGTPFGTETLDDLWHMAYNSTGEFLSANNPTELTQALTDALASISDRTGSAAAVATTSTAVSSDTAIFQALFDSGDWTGNLRRLPLEEQPDGTVEVSDTPDWEAAPALAARDWDTGRTIITRNTDSGNAVPFRFGDLSPAQQTALQDDPATAADDNDGLGQARLRFLRGQRSNELANGGPFRDRQGVLGDIINSEPVRVAEPDFPYPDSWPSGAPENGHPYSAFQSANAGRTPVVYVGANDGMMHGFDASDSSTGGDELIGYVPTPVYEKLPELTDQQYDHRFYADGPMNHADAFFDDPTNPEWRSVVIGNLRTGGRGVYALDVTDPAGFSEGNAGDIGLWEFTPDDDAEMGHVTGSVPIVRLANGEWAAVFGNGYNNTGNGEAVLYVVDIEDGSLIRKISTGAGPSDDPASGTSRVNGLSAPTLVDADGDSIADVAYAGDVFGNLWKFDLTGSNPNSWGIATSGGKPLFEARSDADEPQPITAAPAVGFHPEEPGFLVYTGTGKYLGQSDNTAAGQTTQSIYAVWDERNGSDVERDDLQEQTIDDEPTVSGTETRVVSDEAVDWSSEDGWFLDLDEPGSGDNRGERVVTRPVVQADRVLVSTLLPDSAPCGGGGDSFLMALAVENGGRFGDSIFDINEDGGFDAADKSGGKVVSGIKSKIGIISRATVVYTSSRQTAIYGGTAKPETGASGLTPPGFDLGRKSWQQLR